MSEILDNDFGGGRHVVLSRFRRTDDGSVAVLAAVTFPVVLLCVALAMAAMVWASSEHEAQRAADAAAVRAAATAFLGTDFPYQELPGITSPVTYPDVEAIAAAVNRQAPDNLNECGTVGLPPVPGVPSLPGPIPPLPVVPGAITLPVDCTGVQPFEPPPPLGLPDQSDEVACATARELMGPATASYSNRFFEGTGDSQPSCADRIAVKVATGSPLVGFGQYAKDATTDVLDSQFAAQMAQVQTALAAFGIRLDSSLPSLMCPEISVEIDQPVREPVFDRTSVPNGRATARRIAKNAVIVPVYQGQHIAGASTGPVTASVLGTGVTVVEGVSQTVDIPPVNLNGFLIDAQQEFLTLLDEIDAIADAAVRSTSVTIDQLNGTFAGIDPDEPQPPAIPGTEPVDSLRLTKCLRDTMTQIYDPPTGDAPTADEVLAAAAETGEQVLVVQVGSVQTACTEPGAIALDIVVATPTPTPDCIRAATTPQYDPTTGLYEVPFFDVTPVLVQDVGDGNFATVPLHASQASGAFRAALVRAHDNERYDPVVAPPKPTAICNLTAIPTPTPSTACDIFSVSPSPLLTETPSPTLPSPSPSPSLPVPTSVLPTVTPPPTPTSTPTPSLTCLPLTCGGGL